MVRAMNRQISAGCCCLVYSKSGGAVAVAIEIRRRQTVSRPVGRPRSGRKREDDGRSYSQRAVLSRGSWIGACVPFSGGTASGVGPGPLKPAVHVPPAHGSSAHLPWLSVIAMETGAGSFQGAQATCPLFLAGHPCRFMHRQHW